MKTIQVEIAIIGAGTAGLAAYRAARLHGKRALLIESGPYGTTCARVGCMPSKLLIAAAEAAHAAAAAPAFGVFPGTVRIDGAAVMARVRRERDRFVGFVLEGMEHIPLQDKVRGHARFMSARQLQLDQHTTVDAERIVIATGSSAIVPVAWRGPRVIISDDVFDWVDLPRSVAVIGSGVIGLELGQALHRLGVRVTIFARGTSIAHLSDPQVLQAAHSVLAAEMDCRFGTRIASLNDDVHANAVVLTSVDGAGLERVERFDYVLVAAGRSPNVDQLDLGLAGLALDARGVPLYDQHTMQCGSSAIFIAGDADAELPLLPEAADQGKIAGENAARYPLVQAGLRRTRLAIAFTEPQIATVGASFKELCQSHAGKFALGSVSFEDQGRSRVMLQNQGLLRVYGAIGTGRFLGAEMFGPRAEHLGHLLAWACQSGLTVAQMLEMPFYHPVIEEGVRTALRDLAKQLEATAAPEPCPDCTPGT